MRSLWGSFCGAALLLSVGGSGSSSLHSLNYFSMALSEPSWGLPQFLEVGYLDDQPIVKYDSHTRKMLPQVPWMEKAGKEDPKYWERETHTGQNTEFQSRGNLETLRDRFHQENSTGLHTLQWMYGCEVGLGGRFLRGHMQYAYDGEDFIALDLTSHTWTACVPQARISQQKLDRRLDIAQRYQNYLEETCVEWLQRYLDYGKETRLRTEAPDARVARKAEDHRETLLCQLHGFYPKEIEVTWMKDGQDRKPETYSGGVVPNLDGTYYTWLSIEVDPQERDLYRCHVEHDSLPEPLDLAWEEPASNLRLIPGIFGVLAALLLVGVGVTCYMRKRKGKGYNKAPGSDQGSDTSTKISVPA
ncbi:class I histocompatibility antigen, F10 alpha chain-like [Paroedura picta]|uniref:class I histocompatibility antigen, F10 alpha chain-like n=1 Tax=Paroedura picta TaxID=143630 RepID=UPI00405767DB